MAEALSPALPNALEDAAQALLTECCQRELTLATAESCTGGLLASLLTDVPGCSHAFDRGFVTYTVEAKHDLLGIPEDILDDPGPVSEIVARAMAEGALARSKADLTLSITGFADDDPEKGGLVHFAAASRDGGVTHREERFGPQGRAKVRLECLRVAVEMLDAKMRGG
jgi:nicotinamide-nucleotide amidase